MSDTVGEEVVRNSEAAENRELGFHDNEEEEEEEGRYRDTPYRWVIVLALMGLIFNTSLAHQSIAAVTSEVAAGFGVSILFVNLSITLVPLIFLPFSFLASWMYTKYRRDKVLKFAAFVQILGALIRMSSAITGTFLPIFIGALTLAATAPFGFNSISLIANVWFNNHQHATATGLMGIADVIGALATFLIQGALTYAGFFKSDATPL